MEIDPGTIAVFAAIAFLGALVYGLVGFGAGLVAIPLATHFHDLRFVLAVFALLDSVNAVRMVSSRPAAVVREEVRILVPAIVAGLALGGILVLVLPVPVLMGALGAFVLAFAAYGLLSRGPLPTASRRWAPLAGLAGGVSSTMFGAGGPPYVIYLSMRPYRAGQIRATLVVASLASILGRAIAFGVAGMLSSWAVWITVAAAAPGSLLALWIADRVQGKLSRAAMVRAIQALLCLSGASLLWRAIA